MKTMNPNKRIHTTTSTHQQLALDPSSCRRNSPTKHENHYVDDFISSKLNTLSLEDRSDALNDVHGITEGNTTNSRSRWGETPKGINTKSQEMNKALLDSIMTMKDDQTIGFRKAMELSPQYVDQMKTRFIRSSSTPQKICQQAAKTMIQFFNMKYELFGEDKLVRDIQMHDLRDEEQEALQRGLIQLLPYRDRAGRAVIFYVGIVNELYPSSKNDMVIRTIFYFFMATLNDEETLKNGIVFVVYGLGQKTTPKGRAASQIRLIKHLPFRFVAFHHCKSGDNSSKVWDNVIRYCCDAFEGNFLCRTRFHSGSHVECIYLLMTFGIPKDALPFDEDGSLNLTSHHKILDSLRRREELTNEPSSSSAVKSSSSEKAVAAATTTTSGAYGGMSSFESSSTTTNSKITTSSSASSILIPGPLDIIAGRGRHSKSCMGASRMQNLLLEHRDEYNDSCKATKSEIVDLVLLKLKNAGCRFLTLGPSGFIECNDDISRDKIARGFRNLRIKEKTQGKKRDLVLLT